MHPSFGSSFNSWCRLLYENRFCIHPFHLPKILYLSVGIFSNIPFVIWEKIWYSKRIKETKISSPVFITGYYRSGTTYLHYLLTKDKQFNYCATYQVLMPHVFLTLGRFVKCILRKFLPRTRLMDHMKLDVSLPKEEEFAMANISQASLVNGYYFPKNINSYFTRYVLFDADEKYIREWKMKVNYFLKKVSFANPGKSLIIKSPCNTARIKEIRELYPDAKFINIHRNPYEVYYSNVNLYETILPFFSFQKINEGQIKEFILSSYEEVYKKYLDRISSLPSEDYVDISYEELVQDPMVTLRKVYSKLGMQGFQAAYPYIQAEVKANENYSRNKFVMKENVKEEIYNRWKFMFDYWGYEK